MGALLRRGAVPVIAFLAGLGVDLGGYESPVFAWVLWGIAAVWGLVALVTWAPIGRWLPTIELAWPALQRTESLQRVAEPSVERGFLDFLVDAEKASKELLPRLLTRLGQESSKMAKRLRRHNLRFQKVAGNAQKARKAAADASKDIDRYSKFIEEMLPEFKAGLKLFEEGWIGYLETSPEARDRSKRQGLESFQGTVQELRPIFRTSREQSARFRNSVLALRKGGASQTLNAATDRLAALLAEVIAVMKGIEGALRKIVSLTAKRLEEMN
jgi:hypothetical protein